MLSALWWRRIRGLWKLPDGRDWLRGKLGLVLMGGAMLSKSLIQFSVVLPPCYLTWGQTMAEVMKIMVTSFKGFQASTAAHSAPNPAAGHRQPTPPPETPTLTLTPSLNPKECHQVILYFFSSQAWVAHLTWPWGLFSFCQQRSLFCIVIILKPGKKFRSCTNRSGNAKLLSKHKVLDEESWPLWGWGPGNCASAASGRLSRR